MNIIYLPFEYLLKGCLYISGDSYFLALFFFALAIQIILLPLAIKQHKSQIKMAEIKPKEMAIREKYKGRTDRVTQQKMTMEIQQMYQDNGYSQFSGCLPLLIQLPIIMILFSIVRQPITYAYMGSESLNFAEQSIVAYEFYDKQLEMMEAEKAEITDAEKLKELEAEITTVKNYQASLAVKLTEDKLATYDETKNAGGNAENALSRLIMDGEDDLNALIEKEYIDASILDEYAKTNLSRFKGGLPNYWIGPLNLINEPDFGANVWLMIVPVLVFLSSFLSTKITRKFSASAQQTDANGNPVGGGLFMEVGMPLISAMFAYSMSAAVGVYWIWRTIIGMVQTIILSKAMPIPKVTEEMIAEAKKEMKAKQKKKKIITIEVDEDDNSYDDIIVSRPTRGNGDNGNSVDPARRTPRRIEMLTEDEDEPVSNEATEETTSDDNE